MSTALTVFLPTDRLLTALTDPAASLISPEAPKIRNDLLERSMTIERVVGVKSQEVAVAMLNECHQLTKSVEDLRKQIKAPFQEMGKRIDAAASSYVEPLETEKTRLKGMIGSYQQEQMRIQREAQRKQEEELRKQQQERAMAEAAAKMATTAEQAEKAQEALMKADIAAAAVLQTVVKPVAKAAGMRVIPKWKVEVINPTELHRIMPELVRLEPKMRDIQARVNQMAETQPDQAPALPGCKITAEVCVSTR